MRVCSVALHLLYFMVVLAFVFFSEGNGRELRTDRSIPACLDIAVPWAKVTSFCSLRG